MPKEEETVVEQAPAAVDPTSTSAEEEVTSPEVKPDVQEEPVQKEVVDNSKTQEQINNLNVALKKERESKKELMEKLNQTVETQERLKEALNPTQPEPEEIAGLTAEQVEEMLDRREQQRKEEEQKQAQVEKIKEEVKTLESKWDGTDGKPKYDDKKVLEWQETNGKLHLSPSEAFNEMSRADIIDYELKQRLAKKPDVQNVETPAGNQTREPQEKKPANTEDLRGAVLEAMEATSNENIN